MIKTNDNIDILKYPSNKDLQSTLQPAMTKCNLSIDDQGFNKANDILNDILLGDTVKQALIKHNLPLNYHSYYLGLQLLKCFGSSAVPRVELRDENYRRNNNNYWAKFAECMSYKNEHERNNS